MAMVLTAIYRYTQGESWRCRRVSVIFASGTIGLGWRHFRKGGLADISVRELYALGLLV